MSTEKKPGDEAKQYEAQNLVVAKFYSGLGSFESTNCGNIFSLVPIGVCSKEVGSVRVRLASEVCVTHSGCESWRMCD